MGTDYEYAYDERSDIYTYVDANPVGYSDPAGLTKIHGQWCGPNWTGGYEKPWDQLTSEEQANVKAPEDKLDAACEIHDKCHTTCRATHSCNFAEREQCLRKCDDVLAAAAFPFGGINGFAVGVAMKRPGLRSPITWDDVKTWQLKR